MTPLDKFIETLNPKLPQRLRTPRDGNLSDVAVATQSGLIKATDFELDPATERRIVGRFKVVSEKFCKDKNFQWTPEEFSFAAGCAVAYAQTFQARNRLGVAVKSTTANMDRADDAKYKVVKTINALTVPFHRLATSTSTSNALEMLTQEGIGDPPKLYDEKTAVQFIGVIARNAMQTYSEVVPMNVGVGVYPPRIDPVTQRSMAPEMMIAGIKGAPAGQTKATQDLLDCLNALEEKGKARA